MKENHRIHERLDKLYENFCKAEIPDRTGDEYELLALLLYRIGAEGEGPAGQNSEDGKETSE